MDKKYVFFYLYPCKGVHLSTYSLLEECLCGYVHTISICYVEE